MNQRKQNVARCLADEPSKAKLICLSQLTLLALYQKVQIYNLTYQCILLRCH